MLTFATVRDGSPVLLGTPDGDPSRIFCDTVAGLAETRVAVDVETDGLDPDTLTVRSIQVGWKEGGNHYAFVAALADADDEPIEEMRLVAGSCLGRLKDVWTYTRFDAAALAGDLGVRLGYQDAAKLHHLNDSLTASQQSPLKQAIVKDLGWQKTSMTAKQTIATPTNDSEFLRYAALDVLGLIELVDRWLGAQSVEGVSDEWLTNWLERESRIQDIADGIHDLGARIDNAWIDDLAAKYAAVRDEQEAYIQSQRPGLNIRSAPQLKAVYEDMGFELPKKRRVSKTGAVTYTETTSEFPPGFHPFTDAVSTAKSMGHAIQDLRAYQTAAAADGRVHGTFKPLGTKTSRWSASNPNLQNIPKRGGKVEMRGAFVPSPGHVLVQTDLSQIEYRVAAALSGDEQMRKVYLEGLGGGDLHVLAAKVLSGVEEPTKAQRDQAKAVGFGKLYGQTTRTLAKNAGIDESVAQRRVDKYDRAFPGLKRWADDLDRSCSLSGWTPRNPYGRKFPTPRGGYVGINYLVQSTAREVFCDWLMLVTEKVNPRVVAVVHDEIILDVPEHLGNEVAEGCKEVAGLIKHDWLNGIPIVAEAAVTADRWSEVY